MIRDASVFFLRERRFAAAQPTRVLFVTSLPPGWRTRWNKLLVKGSQKFAKQADRSPLKILDKNQTLVAVIKNALTPLEEVPSHAWQAIVASEDRRFFHHGGLDNRGMARAFLSLGLCGGGSTVTQQVVKNMVLCHILQVYLNNIYWGHGTWGIGQASALYFCKDVADVSLREAALLAGIPYRAPHFIQEVLLELNRIHGLHANERLVGATVETTLDLSLQERMEVAVDALSAKSRNRLGLGIVCIERGGGICGLIGGMDPYAGDCGRVFRKRLQIERHKCRNVLWNVLTPGHCFLNAEFSLGKRTIMVIISK
ncbi:hypothetical protein BSKO_06967 [Bryopsis sp. KO-2023]|nr:hypothetical protein BSKO_06967 [Bryopsis sp. KO-2023]